MYQQQEQEKARIHEQVHNHIKTLFHLDDISGLDLFVLLNRITQMSETMDCEQDDEWDLSGPRWRLMLVLLIQEEMGNKDGLTPTGLSRFQRVSKNTISALLRKLEEQGLIQRNLDPNDLRAFRIQLTQTGRDLIIHTAPSRIGRLNQLLSGLSPQETSQLLGLIEKLHHSIMAQLVDTEKEPC